jgi:hypothetical protein
MVLIGGDTMTKTRYLLAVSAAVLLACGGSEEDGPPADPPGTITLNLGQGFRAYVAPLEQCGAGAPSTTCTSGCRWSHVYVDFTRADLNLNVYSSSSCASQYTAFGIADVGPVEGLAAVTDKNVAGFALVTAAQLGHGYVVRYTKTNTGETSYARLYVVDWLTNAVTGGVNGVQVKWQPF